VPEKKTTAKTTRVARTPATATRAATTTRARAGAAATARRAPARAKAGTPTKAATRASVTARPTRRRSLVGNVIADKTPRTVIVEVTRLRQHPLYKKVIRVRRKFPTHDPNEEAKLGDIVRIEEGRPFSATKRFRVAEVLSRAAEARAAAPEAGAVEAALEELEGVTALRPAKKVSDDAAAPEGEDGER